MMEDDRSTVKLAYIAKRNNNNNKKDPDGFLSSSSASHIFFYLERKSDKGLIFELLCRGVQENKPNSTRETTTKTAYK
jgi:hypothetical protein